MAIFLTGILFLAANMCRTLGVLVLVDETIWHLVKCWCLSRETLMLLGKDVPIAHRDDVALVGCLWRQKIGVSFVYTGGGIVNVNR